MKCNFDSIHAPSHIQNLSLQTINSDFSDCFEKYEQNNSLQQKINFIDFDPFQYQEELFFKKRCMQYNENHVKWTDDILIENMNIPYEYSEKKINFKKTLLFDISSSSNSEDHFCKHKKNFEEISDLQCQDDFNEKIMTYIEPSVIDENNLLLNNNINYNIQLNEDLTCNELLDFTLKKNDFPPFTMTSFSHDKKNELITQSHYNLDFLTSSMYIPKEKNLINSNNMFIDPIIQPESFFDSYIQSMKVMILKFDCKQIMCFEPFTQEWLKDLNISKKDFYEQIEDNNVFNSQSNTLKYNAFKNLNRIQVTVHGDITEEFSPIISKILKNEEYLKNKNNQQIMEIMEAIQKEYEEKEIPFEKMPTIVQINSLFFSDDDILQFGKLFQNLKFIKTELDKKLLLTINNKIANMLIIDDDFSKNISNIIEILGIYNCVIITTTMKPCICLPERIKWRNITSHSQIAAAILPYLVEENSNAKNESTNENNPK